MNESRRELRAPPIFEDGGETHLLCRVAGEQIGRAAGIQIGTVKMLAGLDRDQVLNITHRLQTIMLIVQTAQSEFNDAKQPNADDS